MKSEIFLWQRNKSMENIFHINKIEEVTNQIHLIRKGVHENSYLTRLDFDRERISIIN